MDRQNIKKHLSDIQSYCKKSKVLCFFLIIVTVFLTALSLIKDSGSILPYALLFLISISYYLRTESELRLAETAEKMLEHLPDDAELYLDNQ